MNAVAWFLVGWLALALAGGAFATWFGWHLNRHRSQHARPHVHTRALWLVEREEADRSEPSSRTTRRPDPPPRGLAVYK